jgi:hypothetical protein
MTGCTPELGVGVMTELAMVESVAIGSGVESDCSDAKLGISSELVPCAVFSAVVEICVRARVEVLLMLALGSPTCTEDDCWFRSDDGSRVADGIDEVSIMKLDEETTSPLLVATGTVLCAEVDCSTRTDDATGVAEGTIEVSLLVLGTNTTETLLIAEDGLPCAEVDCPACFDDDIGTAVGLGKASIPELETETLIVLLVAIGSVFRTDVGVDVGSSVAPAALPEDARVVAKVGTCPSLGEG